ncbi:hypothetical protein SARC_01069 [Sphaeroforma arctica JP610]|uniref:Uncharacterized protein n=1 Tax=Sphaeroforma arctica JP610 TaxID=667725 RepID=A0A0L0GCR6_9EUKA|nr:hypothetical protein SARC_01069 [Sphaeroforma arctica JP610]KNC86807.1 hypothetical protein SARC_01069 [Sphaeroforma arctica JP610]|eukprot:XP_014160709.1 hypothetical protein SARC_01069 [Sphaeroforma arctica JP610]
MSFHPGQPKRLNTGTNTLSIKPKATTTQPPPYLAPTSHPPTQPKGVLIPRSTFTNLDSATRFHTNFFPRLDAYQSISHANQHLNILNKILDRVLDHDNRPPVHPITIYLAAHAAFSDLATTRAIAERNDAYATHTTEYNTLSATNDAHEATIYVLKEEKDTLLDKLKEARTQRDANSTSNLEEILDQLQQDKDILITKLESARKERDDTQANFTACIADRNSLNEQLDHFRASPHPDTSDLTADNKRLRKIRDDSVAEATAHTYTISELRATNVQLEATIFYLRHEHNDFLTATLAEMDALQVSLHNAHTDIAQLKTQLDTARSQPIDTDSTTLRHRLLLAEQKLRRMAGPQTPPTTPPPHSPSGTSHTQSTQQLHNLPASRVSTAKAFKYNDTYVATKLTGDKNFTNWHRQFRHMMKKHDVLHTLHPNTTADDAELTVGTTILFESLGPGIPEQYDTYISINPRVCSTNTYAKILPPSQLAAFGNS